MFEDRLERVKKEIRSVIITFPNGVSLTGFLKAYKQLLGMHLPTREFGYISDIDFLFSLPDVISIGTNKNGDYELKCVADENTKHIQQLVSKQKISKPKKSHSTNKNSTTVRNNLFEVKPFVSATLRENLFKILSEYPGGISYSPLLLAYHKMFKKQLNLNWLSDNHDDRLKKLASAVSELEVRNIDNTEKLFYFPNKVGKKENLEEPKTFLNYTPFKATTLTRNRKNDIRDKTSCVCAISQTLKDDFEKVMKQFPNGILAKHFPALYEKLIGKVFNLSDLGFNSFLELADTLPEIFICERYESCNDLKLFHPIFKKSGSQLKDFDAVLGLSTKKLEDINVICKQDVFCDISSPTIPYAKPQFPNDICLTEYIPVFISAVISPSHFWFKLQFENVVSRFRDLEEKMQYFYHSDLSGRLKMKSKDITVGTTCAAEHEDCWYRVTVVTSVQYEFVQVHLVDYGSCEKIKISSLRYLKSEFITLPAQAFKAELAFVKPFKNSRSWSERAENRFLELCDVSCLMAQIHSQSDDKFSVFLCDTSGEDDIHVNDVLVEEGLAESGTESLSLEKDSDLTSGMNRTCNDALNRCKQVLTKKVFLGDGYKIHIIVVAKEAYVCAGELCSLFWPNKPSEMLKSRLELKSIVVPSIKISKEDHKELFYQCESFCIQDFHHVSLSQYSVELYPLSFVMKVLNALGHPSIKVRKTIKKELQNFDPFNISWRTSNDKDTDSSGPKLEGINNLCMYDLKVLHETIKCKKIKLKSDLEKRGSDNVVMKELEQVKKFESTIKNRIDYIQSICSSYSSGDN